jgi:TRAP-type C4-dicarboxylate transport system substrate-binding protein
MEARRAARAIGRTLAAVLALGLAACGTGGADKAGGSSRQEPVVLTLASNDPYLPGQLEKLPEDIEQRSGGTLKIDYKPYWRGIEPEGETGLIADVRAGQIDMAFVGVRAFDVVGITNFQPLVAPFLVDSYDLEGEVFEAGIPQRMLQAIDTIGLTGIGVVPGPMSKIMGVAHPFAKRTDFEGAVVGTTAGDLADDTIRALGATPKLVARGTVLDGLDGLDDQLSEIRGSGYYNVAYAVTANVDLWPEPLAVFMNTGRFADLTSAQQDVLRSVVAGHVAPALAASRLEDTGAASGLCQTGLTIAKATPEDIAGLQAAAEPVYAKLQQEPANQAAFIETTTLKKSLATPPESFDCVAPQAPPAPSAVTPLDGVYEMTISSDELAASGDLVIPENYGSYITVYDRGRFAVTQASEAACTWGYGTYVVNGDRFEMTYANGGGVSPNHVYNRPGESFFYGWSLYRDELTFTDAPGKESPPGWRAKPWTRTGATTSLQALDQRCPPPAAALWPAAATAATTSTT